MQHVFVYGSLLFPEIVSGLTGRRFENVDAVLPGFIRLTVKDNDYPAIIARTGQRVPGKILLNVDERSLEVLRFFEGDDYRCMFVEAEAGNKSLQVCAFVWNGKRNLLVDPEWNPSVFERTALADYVRYVVPETVESFERLFS